MFVHLPKQSSRNQNSLLTDFRQGCIIATERFNTSLHKATK